MLGLQVLDWLPLGDLDQLQVRFSDGSMVSGVLWSELIENQGAEVLATFMTPVLSGRPAVTLNRFGAGTAQYVGTQLDRSALARLMKSAWTRAGAKPVSEVPSGVEAVRRIVPGGSLCFSSITVTLRLTSRCPKRQFT